MRWRLLIGGLFAGQLALVTGFADELKDVTPATEAAAKAKLEARTDYSPALNTLIYVPVDFGAPEATEPAASRGVRVETKGHVQPER